MWDIREDIHSIDGWPYGLELREEWRARNRILEVIDIKTVMEATGKEVISWGEVCRVNRDQEILYINMNYRFSDGGI